MPARTRAAGALAVLLLASGCGVDARGELRSAVENITVDANARDADAVRTGVQDLLQRLEQAVRDGDVTRAEADRITALAIRLRDAAGLLEPAQTPSPTPTVARPSPTTASPTPEPTEQPSPTSEPSPTKTPSPTRTPEPTAQPGTTGPPVVVEPTLSPVAEVQPAEPSPPPTD